MAVSDFLGQIDILHPKGILVDIVVDGLFGQTDLFRVRREDVVNGLAFGDERLQDVIDLAQSLRRGADPFSGVL